MKNWQKGRNYKRLKDKNGNIIANIITVDGIDVEVTEEVFLAYSQAERRERYIVEELEPGKILSLDKLLEDQIPLDELGVEQEPSTEAVVLSQECIRERIEQRIKLTTIFSELNEDEKQLIQALFFDGISAREYARQIGVRLRTVQYRRDKLLNKLRQKILL